ncbi:TPA: hypothetical protein N0F65_007391 [Lagenidium giganteum]|uniref:Uncharacterized protein n=1 Tax=Lagenidium giganteum TaxID=4803 RepID=A0AAV2ZIE4_9STRA|nr:TPA: hypothetical protein N0F65_007391 [Lagenidium giganteum]
MCNFVKANGEQCKLAPRKERCGKHPIIIDQENIVVESNIVEEMPPQTNTPVASEVVHTLTTSVIKPIEASNAVSDDSDDSDISPVIADSAVYKEEDIKPDQDAYKDGDRYCYYIQQGNRTLIHYYCKSKQMMMNIPKLINEYDVVNHCLASEKYDKRLLELCSLFPKSWFQNPSNLWMLAGHMATRPHVDIHCMMRTYACLLKTNLTTFDYTYSAWKAKYEPKQEKKEKKMMRKMRKR